MVDLGPGPAILADDEAALVQSNAGYWLTDLHALFQPGTAFLGSGHYRQSDPVRVQQVGTLELRGSLAVFDPVDMYAHETVQKFSQTLPSGEFPVYTSRTNGLQGILIRFSDVPVHCWTPALRTWQSCPEPPLMPQAQVRFSLGLIGGDVDPEEVADGEYNEELKRCRENKAIEDVIDVNDVFVAFDSCGAGAWASWFGLDEIGEVAAWVLPFECPRVWKTESFQVPVSSLRADRAPKLKPPVVSMANVELRQPNPDRIEFRGNIMPEGLRVTDVEGASMEPTSTQSSRGVRTFIFAQTLPTTGTIEFSQPAVSFPVLMADPVVVERQFRHWQNEGLLLVEESALPDLAQRYVAEAESHAQSWRGDNPADVRDWLVDQDDVEDVMF